MKKSFWGVMLTLAALVMMLGASSAFANASGDITISFDMDATYGSITSGGTATLQSADSADGSSVTTVTVADTASSCVEVEVTAVDDSSNWHIVLDLKTVSFDPGTETSGDAWNKTGVVSASITSAAVKTSNVSASVAYTTLSIDIAASADTDPFVVNFIVHLSDDTTSADFAFAVKVSADYNITESGAAFSDTTITVTDEASTELGTVDVTSADWPALSDSTYEAVSADLTEAKFEPAVAASGEITFTVADSSNLVAVHVTSGDETSSYSFTDLTTLTYELSTDETAKFYFVFSSTDTDGTISYGGVTFSIAEANAEDETGKSYGDFTLVAANQASGSNITVTSKTYADALCDSADETATAISSTGTYTAEDVTKFTLTYSEDAAGDDGTISIVEVYDVADASNIEAISGDVLDSTRKIITPAVAGSYRILFKATPKTTSGTVTTGADSDQYFTVNFSLEEDGSDEDTPEPINDSTLTDSSKAVSDFNNSTSGAVSESEIAALDSDTSIEGLALKVGYADFFKTAGVKTLAELLAHVPTTGGFTYPQYALMKLTTEASDGDTIIVRLMTASAIGADPTSSSTTYAGTFVSKAASQYIIIDTYNLRQPSTPTSTLTLPEGIYAILAQIYTSASTESVSIAATADGMAKLAADGYSGNVASKITGSNKGSSSGCDAGFGALALLALALPLVKKFSK